MDTTWILLLANVCISSGYVLVKIGKAFIKFGQSLKDPAKKEANKKKKITKLEYKLNKVKEEK